MDVLSRSVALVAFLWWWRQAHEYLHGRTSVQRRLLAGLLLFVGSATVTEIPFNFATDERVVTLLITAEEVGELCGATLFLWGVGTLLSACGADIRFGAHAAESRGAVPR